MIIENEYDSIHKSCKMMIIGMYANDNIRPDSVAMAMMHIVCV